jgi:pimeloyl-ACP methyl ester carboxylesterase
MPYANNQGVRIHYEVEGDGAPLVLVHGLGWSLEEWRQLSYAKSLKNDYRLILIDARGHGSSDKSHDPAAYRLESIATDLVAVLDDLKLSRAHYFGYSFGGWVGWGIAKHAPERFHSLIIGGCGPPRKRPPEEPNFFLDLFQKGKDMTLATLGQMFGPRWRPEFKAVVEAMDLEALIALVSGDDWGGLDFDDILPTLTVPCLLLVGEDADEYPHMTECAGSIANATFVSFPGLDHIEAIFRTDLLVPHIRKFLAGVGEG